jgi:hypothetical protein
MAALGWEPYQNDHEDANGQYEARVLDGSALRDMMLSAMLACLRMRR